MEAVKSIMPFSNEVANVLTTSGFAIFSGLYKDLPKTNAQKMSKMVFDLVALIGIILNAVHTTKAYGTTAGLIKGVVVIIIAFVIPNLTFHTIIEKVCKRCNHFTKLLFGLFLIALLTGFEFLFDHYILELFHEDKSEDSEESTEHFTKKKMKKQNKKKRRQTLEDEGETEAEIAAKEEAAN